MSIRLTDMADIFGSDTLPDVAVSRATSDSRRADEGALFFALQGEHVDGHDFVAQAKTKGAVAIVGGRDGITEFEGLPYLGVPNPRYVLGVTAHRLAGDPSRAMQTIGVTGTNGKTSTVCLIAHILERHGLTVAQFGTLGYRVGAKTLEAAHTTPFAEDLASLFAQAREVSCTHVVMEVSSHALEQDRVAGIAFDIGVFTNLTQDHLDYHESMEAYLRQKVKLFESIEGEGRYTIVNLDDPAGKEFVAASKVPCYTYGAGGDCRAADVHYEPRRTVFTAETPWGSGEVSMRLLGGHNVSNALAAIAVCGAVGVPFDAMVDGIESLDSVPGRFEHVDEGQPFQVIVDYAHTEDGLLNVLRAAREICTGRVICVFGCGGDRDKGKRPKMAAVCAELADFSIVTSDNPRTESPERILLDIEVGLQHAGKKRDEHYLVFVDRAEAIGCALDRAEPGDLVLIAGKGHEDYQIFGTEKRHFDDREIAREKLGAIRA